MRGVYGFTFGWMDDFALMHIGQNLGHVGKGRFGRREKFDGDT